MLLMQEEGQVGSCILFQEYCEEVVLRYLVSGDDEV